MKRKIFYAVICLIVLSSYLVGCNTTEVQENSNDAEMSKKLTTRLPLNRGNIIDKNRMNNDVNDITGKNNMNSQFKNNIRRDNNIVAEENTCRAKINDLATVNNCEVVFMNETAYVGCDLNRDAKGLNMQNLRNNILNKVKEVNPNITKCYIMTNRDNYNSMKVISDNMKNMNNNNSMNVYQKNLNDMVVDIQPVNVVK